MKKLLSMLVIICVLISACLVGAMPAAAAEINYDDFDIYDGILVEYLGEGGDVVIPAKDAEGNPVTEIDSRAFMDNDTITSVVIPEGITKLGSEVFQYCDYLETVSLPFSLEKSGISTFRFCPSLTKIEIPSSLKNIPQDFCSGCSALSEIILSYGVETIGVYSFSGMKNIDRIVIPASVTDIFGFAFSNSTMDECDVYICNPLCEVGYMNGYRNGSITGKEYNYSFASPEHKRTSWTIYVPKGSVVAEDMNKQNEKFTNLNYRIREAEQSVFDALPENQKDYGYQDVKPENEDNDGDGVADGNTDGQQGGNNGANNTVGGLLGGNTSNGGAFSFNQILILVGIIFGGLILIIVIVVVVVIVVKNNKKKKKAAAKAARRAAKAAAEAPVEEVVEEAPVEEIVDEVPTEDAE